MSDWVFDWACLSRAGREHRSDTPCFKAECRRKVRQRVSINMWTFGS